MARRVAFARLPDEPAEFRDSLESLAAPAVLRGTVRGSAGVTPGVVDGPTRAANLAALQANVNYADANRKFFELEPASVSGSVAPYQIAGAPLVIPPNGAGLVWRGAEQTIIEQCSTDMAAVEIGSFSNVTPNAFRYDIDGLWARYGVSQLNGATPYAGSSALKLGSMGWSKLDNIVAGGGSFRPNIALHIPANAGPGFFSNSIGKITASGGYQSAFDRAQGGTQSTWENAYFSIGDATTSLSCTAPIVKIVSAAIDGDRWGLMNIEHGIAGQALYMELVRSMLIDNLHVEYFKGNGFSPAVIYLSLSSLKVTSASFRNWYNRTAYTEGGGASGTPTLVNGYGRRKLEVDSLWLRYERNNGAHQVAVDRGLHLFGYKPEDTAEQPKYEIGNLEIDGPDLASVKTYLNMDGTYTGGTYQFPIRASSIFCDRAAVDTVGSKIELTANATIYGMHKHCDIVYPAAITAARTVTLSDFVDAAGGKRPTQKVAPDSTRRVVRAPGTADGFTLTVNNNAGSSIGTIAAAATELWFRRADDNSAWVAM